MSAPELVITRGLPGAGKTTWAREWVAEAEHRTRINRDDLRTMMFGGWTGDDVHEWAVTLAQHAAVARLLDEGRSVVCDDTNLNPEVVEVFRQIAAKHGATLTIADFTDVPVEVCISRDAARRARGERYVGEQVIRAMASVQSGVAS